MTEPRIFTSLTEPGSRYTKYYVKSWSLQRFAAGPPAATDAPPSSRGLFAAIEATPPAFRGLFSEFQSVASAAGGLPPVKHKTVHHIRTAGPPAKFIFEQFCRSGSGCETISDLVDKKIGVIFTNHSLKVVQSTY